MALVGRLGKTVKHVVERQWDRDTVPMELEILPEPSSQIAHMIYVRVCMIMKLSNVYGILR